MSGDRRTYERRGEGREEYRGGGEGRGYRGDYQHQGGFGNRDERGYEANRRDRGDEERREFHRGYGNRDVEERGYGRGDGIDNRRRDGYDNREGYGNRGRGDESSYGSRGDYGNQRGREDGYRGGYNGRGGRGGGDADRERGGYRGGGGYRGDRGGFGGNQGVSSAMESMNLCDEPAPLPFIRPKDGEEDGYKAAAKQQPASRVGKKTFKVVLNSWPMEFDDRPVYSYDITVSLELMGNDKTTRVVNVSKRSKDDSSTLDRNELVKAALKAGLEYNRILSDTGIHISNGAALMFTNECLQGALKQFENKIRIPMDEIVNRFPVLCKLVRTKKMKNILIEVNGSKSFNIKEQVAQMTNVNRTEIDQTAKQFLEILTTDYGVSSGIFDFFNGGKMYRSRPEGNNREFPKTGFGQERRPGLTKGVFVGEKNGSIISALNIDVTTGTFWCNYSLEQTIMEINGWRSQRDVVWNAWSVKNTYDKLKGLRVWYNPPNGSEPFEFSITGISATFQSTTDGKFTAKVITLNDAVFTNDQGDNVQLSEKYKNVDLRLTSWPLVEWKRSRPSTAKGSSIPAYFIDTQYFPIELLHVNPNQRAALNKQGGAPVRPIRVDDRWKRTCSDLEALNLFGDTRGPYINPILKAFGIRVAREPLTTTAITRRMPTVTLNQQRSNLKKNVDINEKTSFDTRFLAFERAAHITTLFIVFSTDPSTAYHFNIPDFAKIFVTAAKNKGMRIDYVQHYVLDPPQLYRHLAEINTARKTDPKLKNMIFLYIEPEVNKHHDELKLFERRFCIITQHLKMENAGQLAGKKIMMENVLLKLNVKGGGHNYYVTPEIYAMPLWMEQKTMIMGYDVCHPTGQSRADKMADRLPDPSVVGFSFNGGINPDSFIGDYHYQQATRERVNDSVLNARIKWMLSTFEKSRGVLPPLIIVVRDGISDGQHSHAMDELETLREGAAEYAVSKQRLDMTGKSPVPDYRPDFIFVVATKRHHKRSYAVGERGLTNMAAMSVIDDTITDPSLFEFYMQSHTPIQGTAKPTRYTVLKNDVGATQDAMQSLMGALCFEHQISTNAISIPEPVYQSDEWAKRGAANMRLFKQMFGENGQFKKGFTYDDLTTSLSYWNCALENVRVNA